MPYHTCPTCGQPCTPVYCAASTPDRPLLLAYTVRQAAARLGVAVGTLQTRGRLQLWGDGWRLRPLLRPSPKAGRKEAA